MEPIINKNDDQTNLEKKLKDSRAAVIRGLVDVIMLKFLRTQPSYGYELMSKILENFGVTFEASIIYPTLASLERKGYIASQWITDEKIRPRKIYNITTAGQEMLTLAENALKIAMEIPIAEEQGAQ